MITLQLGGVSSDIPLVWAVSIGGVIAFAIGVFVRVQLENREQRRDPVPPAFERLHDEVAGSTATPDGGREAPSTNPPSTDDVNFRIATTRLDQGRYTRAIQTAYCHTRTQLAERFGIEIPGTHRDFYEECAALDRDLDGLEEFTELYERVMFSPASIDREDAERALALTTELTEPEPANPP